MQSSALKPRLILAALAITLASYSTPAPEPTPPPTPVSPLPSISLNQGVAESASVYVAFIRGMAEVRAGFPDAASVQVLPNHGAAYDPGQLSRGMIAYVLHRTAHRA